MSSLRRRRHRTGHLALNNARGFRPSIEAFERRELMAGNFLQGIATLNGSPVAGASIALYSLPSNQLVATSPFTQSDGRYLFSGLAAGSYDLVETPPVGDSNASATGNSQLDQSTVMSPSSIDVTIGDPSTTPPWTLNTLGSNTDPIYFNVVGAQVPESQPLGSYTGSFSVVVDETDITYTTSTFSTYCVDLNRDISAEPNGSNETGLPYTIEPLAQALTDPTSPSYAGTSVANAGRIAYLFNHHGQDSLTAAQSAGLQLAIWALEYTASPTDVGDPLADFHVTSGDPESLAAISAADGYLSESAGKSEIAVYLDGLPGAPLGSQGLLATGSFNFDNKPKATPAINTQASEAPGNVVGVAKLSDSATLSGGYLPTGSIVFTLTTPNGSVLQEGSVNVTGDGSYASPSVLATQVGNYTWHAVYSGDTNNVTVADNGVNEGVTTVKATPAINTQAGETAGGVVGVAKLSDSATLSGGYLPTGSIVFTLTTPNGSVLQEGSVNVTGDGSYASPSVLATQVGNYTWHAVYSGDTNNVTVADNGVNEGVTTVKATPSINTTPGATVTMGGISISGAKYQDLTGNGFSADDTPLGGVTINLYAQSNGTTGLQTGSDVLVASTKTASDGTYSFPVSNPGTYFVQEVVPSGSIQTGGGPNGSAGNTYYTIVATSGQSYPGNLFDDFQIPTCAPTNVSYKVTTPSNHSSTVSDLSGNTDQGDTVTVTFTVPSGMNDQLTLVSYYAPGSSWSDSNAYQQVIYQQATGIFTPGTHCLTVTIPNGDYQIDFICGQAINQFEPNQNNNAYGPDGANITYHAEGRFIDSDNGGNGVSRSMPAPTPNAPLVPASPPTPTTTLTDTAALSGTYNGTGTITFYLFAPGVMPNSTNSNNVYSDKVTVNGDGSYSTSTGTNPGGYTPTAAGTYQWVAVYSGDGKNATVTEGYGNEPEVVGKAATSISTVAGGTVTCGGSKLTDTATLSGGVYPTGMITFTLTSPSGKVVDTETVTVKGDGTYSTPSGYSPTAAGTYTWSATYSGDTTNATATDNGQNESAVVSPPSVCKGQTQSCSYWSSWQGQSLIDCLNGGSRSQNLGNWLASTCPNLFGNLKGCSNSQVASYCQTLSYGNSNQQACAQVLSTALSAYVTNSNLAGNSGQNYGFTVSNAGLGACGWNVGSYGSGLGLSNNQTYCITDLLAQIDGLCSNGSLKAWAVNSANSLCSNLNQY